MAENRESGIAVGRGERAAAPAKSAVRPLLPPVDVYENDDGIVLSADMPGVTKEGLEVVVDKNVLTIKGSMADIIPHDIKPLYAEFGAREYERAFTLGPDVDAHRIEASMSAGVLKLFIPKSEDVRPRKIEVKAG